MPSAVVSVGLALLLGAAEPSPLPAPPRPPDEGLCLWLDAADQKTVEVGPDGAVLKWRNRVDGKSAASAVGAGHAALVRDGINGLPALRLDGAGGFVAPGLGPDACDVAAFVVFRQSKEQAAKAKGQPLLVALDAKGGAETGDAALKMAADDRPLADAAAPALYQLYRHEVRMGQVAIGCSGKEVTQGYCGDIAEVLIYDRKAAREDVILWACAYLARKWNAPVMLPRRNWTLEGPLPNPPARVTDKLPLSDQRNRGGWVAYAPMTDEFNGTALDETKWINAPWGGPSAARNVAVRDGSLQITMPKDPAMFEAPKSRAAGTVISRTQVQYGYFEVRSRAMPSTGSSAFWFFSHPDFGKRLTLWHNELDVFELTGKSTKVDPHVYNMAMHTAHGPDGRRMPTSGGYWKAPWNFSDDFHVCGVQWDEDWVRFYVDGVLVHEVENALMHAPQNLIFDSEVMKGWFGLPRAEDLPSTFYVDYVRAWKRQR